MPALLLTIAIIITNCSVFSQPAHAKPLPLHHRSFHCCTVTEFPIVYRDETHHPHGYAGLGIAYLERLQARLGFTCSDFYEYREKGTSFTSFIKHLEACTAPAASSNRSSSAAPNTRYDPSHPVCKCDIGIGGWMTTRERIGRVIYAPDFLRSEVVVLTHVDNTASSNSGDFFQRAFTPPVWLSIGALFLLFTFLRMLDGRFEKPSARHYVPLVATDADATRFMRAKHFLLKSHVLYRLRKAACRTALEMIGQAEPSAGMTRNSTRQWVLSFGVLLSGLFLVLTYEATMTASLVQERVHAEFRSVADLRECRISVDDICIPKGGVEESYWRNSIAKAPCSQGKMPRFIQSYAGVVDKVVSKQCKYVLVAHMHAADGMTGKHCKHVVKVGKPVFWGGLAYVMPLNTEKRVVNAVRNATLDLIEQGKLKSVEQFYEERGDCQYAPSESISMRKIRLFFLFALVFIVVMFLAMVIDPHREAEEEKNEQQMGMKANVSKMQTPLGTSSSLDDFDEDDVMRERR